MSIPTIRSPCWRRRWVKAAPINPAAPATETVCVINPRRHQQAADVVQPLLLSSSRPQHGYQPSKPAGASKLKNQTCSDRDSPAISRELKRYLYLNPLLRSWWPVSNSPFHSNHRLWKLVITAYHSWSAVLPAFSSLLLATFLTDDCDDFKSFKNAVHSRDLDSSSVLHTAVAADWVSPPNSSERRYLLESRRSALHDSA